MTSIFMEQELKCKKVAIVGCGAAGGLSAVLLAKNPCVDVTVFDIKEPFSSLLPTGGGRCNITNAQADIKDFVKNYPRGEKFLLSVFSKFDQSKTRKLFEELGIETYVQPDGRVFPVSDSSKKTIEQLLKHLNNTKIKKEKVISIQKKLESFQIETDKKTYSFDSVILATGGSKQGMELAKQLGHKIIEPRPSLCALDIKEKEYYSLSGLSFRNVEVKMEHLKNKISSQTGDILFTHNSISGPAVFKISALSAYENLPFFITIKIADISIDEVEMEIKNNIKKSIKNVFSKFAPESFIQVVLKQNNIDPDKQVSQIKKSEKEIIYCALTSLKLTCIGRIKGSEIVTAGGVDLDEVNAKSMESKLIKNLYIVGEILNVDGFTGGYNLQNAWSGAYLSSLCF